MQSVAGKTYGTVSADRQREMSGLEFVRGLVEGTLPLNTIAGTLGYDIIEAETGRVVRCRRTEEQSSQPGWHRTWRSRSDNA